MFGPPVGVAIEQWKDVLNINFAGVVRCVNAFMPAIIERGYGWVITFSSLAGIMTYPGAEGSGLYVTSKFAVHGYSESLNLYPRPRGIGVTCAFPGRVATGFGTRGRWARRTPRGTACQTGRRSTPASRSPGSSKR